MTKPPSLRAILATVTAVVAVLALLVCGVLVSLTTLLHRTTESVGDSVENVRLAEEATIDLLLHERTNDVLVKGSLEGDLRRRFLEARGFVASEEEARALAEAESRVDAYVAGSRDRRLGEAEIASLHGAAYRALERLVAINVAQARSAREDAARWDLLGDVVGLGAGALVVLVAGVLVVWLRRRAFAPVFELASAMERFGKGDRNARAAEVGPRELRDMCVRFNEMASVLSARREAQLAFLGGVAHDLRNPLSALKLSVGLLGRDRPLPSEERLRQGIERLRRQITRMERMLGDFLEGAKIEAGQLELRLGSHDARKLVEDVVELFEATSPDHPLEVRLPEHAAILRCDPLRIEQVVTNLISNAIKYSPAGSVVGVAVETRDDEVELRVTDRGVGISEADRARLFEPFRRVGLSKETAPGVGLGLFVVKKIVEAHGGHIEVESEPGQGSSFRVFLPLGGHDVQERSSAEAAQELLH